MNANRETPSSRRESDAEQNNAPRDELTESLPAKEARKLAARRRGSPRVWFGLGMLGMVGWSIAVPMLIGAMLGRWLDQRWPGPASWTLTLLFAAAAIGCWHAWVWLQKEIDRE